MSEDLEDGFQAIRPYNDIEAKSALARAAEDPHIEDISSFLFPGKPVEELREKLRNINGVEDFQINVMKYAIRAIVDKTSSGLTYSGIDNIKDGKKHLFISNHRDIILDPAIIQIIFYENDLASTEIAVGDNLMTSPFIEDLSRSNRMITVRRGGTPRELYTHSNTLSHYIRRNIVSEKCSVWIAQRNGRSKNGIDCTEQGLLKMLEMSAKNDFVQDFADLSIVPLSISYQYEPCDFLKARELFISRRERYVKKPGEDLISIITGVRQFKGNIHYHFGKPLSLDDIKPCAQYNKNEKFLALGKIIDEKINPFYQLWNNNYIAYDLLNASSSFSGHYSAQEEASFSDYMENGLSSIVKKDHSIDRDELREIFLSIYANPIGYSL